MLVNPQDLEPDLASTEVQKSDDSVNKRGGFRSIQEGQRRRWIIIRDRIASIAVLDLNPELYRSDDDLYFDDPS